MKFEQVNYLMDVIMPTLANANAFAVASLVARNTWGMKDTEWVELSYTDIREATGIKSDNTVKKAIKAAEKFVEQRPKEAQGFEYRMKTVSEIDGDAAKTLSISDISKNDTLSKNDREPYQKMIGTVSKNDRVSGGIKEKESNSSTTTPEILMLKFTELTALFPPHDTTDGYRDDWLQPMQRLLDFFPDNAEKRVEESIKILREKNYRIKNPGSIYTAAVNWRPSTNGHNNGAAAHIAVDTAGGYHV